MYKATKLLLPITLGVMFQTMFGHPFAGLQEIDMHSNIVSELDYDRYNWYVTPNAEWNLQV